MNPTADELARWAASALRERPRPTPAPPWQRTEPPRRRDTKKGHRR